MTIHTICILGGTGFVGRALTQALITQPEITRIRILTRKRNPTRKTSPHLLQLFQSPKVELAQCDIHDLQVLQQQFSNCDAVINLIGILEENRKQTFQQMHVELVRKIVEACHTVGVKRLLHMSALHAGVTNAESRYLKTKDEGEQFAHQQFDSAPNPLNVTSFRPSVIFGEDDQFFNRFAKLLKLPSLVVPLPCAEAKFAPIFVSDVVDAFVNALNDPKTYSKKYDLCGPKIYTLMELMEYTEQQIGVRRLIVGLSDDLAKLQARWLGWLPGMMTMDNFLSMQIDSVCDGEISPDLNLQLTPLEEIVPNYLSPKSKKQTKK